MNSEEAPASEVRREFIKKSGPAPSPLMMSVTSLKSRQHGAQINENIRINLVPIKRELAVGSGELVVVRITADRPLHKTPTGARSRPE